MGLLSKSKSNPPDARAGASPADDEVVREARAKARRRLIGAALLLGIGIIGFPLLFETQPRPIAVDIPIEIPSRESVPPLAGPASRPARAPVATALPKPTAEPPASVAAARPPEPKPPEPKPEAKPAEAKPPEAKPAPKPVEAKSESREAKPAEAARANDDTTKDDGRYVVQIGAFAEATGAREARMKVEGLGLKTYTQVIESSSGRRIRVRVGPYATKAEAEKAAAKIKAGGLQAAVLVL